MGFEHGSEPGTPGDIGRRAVSGAIWKIFAGLVNQILRFAVLIVLARILGPSDFGLAALVMTFAMFGPVFSDFSLGNALVYKETVTRRETSTVFWTCTMLGLFFTALGVGLAFPLGAFFGHTSFAPMFIVFSTTFLVMSLVAVPIAVLTRQMRFALLQGVSVVTSIVGAGAALVVAVMGFGPWAVLTQYLVQTVANAALLWVRCGWRPGFEFSRSDLRGIAKYSSAVFGSYFLLQVTPVAQNVLVGRLLGAPPLGTLVVMQNVSLLPANRITQPVMDVLFPVLSRLRGDRARTSVVWARSVEVSALAALPALLGLVVVAPDFVAVVLGSKWAGSETVLRLLALAGIFLALQPSTLTLFQACGAIRRMVTVTAGSAAATIIAVAAGSGWGLTGVAIGLVIQAAVIQAAAYAYVAQTMEVGFFAAIRPLGSIVAASACSVVPLAAVHRLLVEGGLGPLPRLVLSCVVGGVGLVFGMRVFARHLVYDILRRLPGRFRPSELRAPPVGAIGRRRAKARVERPGWEDRGRVVSPLSSRRDRRRSFTIRRASVSLDEGNTAAGHAARGTGNRRVMDLIAYWEVVRRRRRIIYRGLAVSIALAVVALLTVDGSGIRYRAPAVMTATSTLLVTQEGFPWGRSALTEYIKARNTGAEPISVPRFADPTRMEYLGALYTELANGDFVHRRVLPEESPETDDYAVTTLRAPDGRTLPLIEITATSTSADRAVEIARGVTANLKRYVQRQQEANDIPAGTRILLPVITSADQAEVLRGPRRTTAIMLFLLGLVGTCFLAFVVDNLRGAQGGVKPARGSDDAAPVSVAPVKTAVTKTKTRVASPRTKKAPAGASTAATAEAEAVGADGKPESATANRTRRRATTTTLRSLEDERSRPWTPAAPADSPEKRPEALAEER